MKILMVTFLGIFMLISDFASKQKDFVFYLGTYTDSGSKGIYKFTLTSDGTIIQNGLVAETENPSYIALSNDKNFLIAINEINDEGNGSVESYKITDEGLKLISKQKSGGAHPCYVAINGAGYVVAANYTGGNVGLLKIDKHGILSPLLDVDQHTGRGSTERQTSPHAHSAYFEGTGNEIISCDLGTDALWFSEIDNKNDKFIHRNLRILKMKDGAGPRHIALHPNGNWIYVVNELDYTVSHVIKSENNNYSIVNSYSTLPEDFKGANTCADIHITKGGKYLYASNRGHNSIAIFKVNGENGSLKLIDNEVTKGEKPRNFAISPDERYLLVANQATNNLVCFKRDKNTGLLSYISETQALKPVCILFCK
jgi:6-phosphogluconolactonase